MESFKEIITKVITVGRIESYQEMELINSRDLKGQLLWDHNEEFWKKICVDLSTEDIEALLKSLVFADGRYKNWSTYSVMHYCFYLLSILRERLANHTQYDNILDWIFQNRKNTYIPFIGGNIPLSVKSVEDFRKYSSECRKEREKKVEAERIEYEEAQKRKEVRKLAAIQNNKNNLVTQKDRKDIREKNISELKTFSKIEIMRKVLNDEKHSIEYYSEEFANIGDEEIDTLELSEKQALAKKLNSSKGPWRQLRNKLLNNLKNLT